MNTDTLPMLSPQDWAMLRDHVRLVPYQRGSVILSEGGYRRALHIVKSGAVRVEEEQDGHAIALAMLGPGEIFGEMGFVENAPASASVVVAQDDAEIEVIEDAALQSLMASEPGFAVRFYHSIAIALSRRLRTTSQRLAQTGIAEVAQVNKFRVPRTGNISTRQVPPQLSAGLDAFERTMLSISQELRAGALSEPDAAARVRATCDSVVGVLRQFIEPGPLVDIGWSDLLAFRDPEHLEAGIGDYVFRETFRTFMLSATISRCYAKPRGFPDDYETMAIIYANEPDGDDRLGPLIDRWFLDRPICRSRRAACDRAQTLLLEKAKAWMTRGEPVKVTSLASGAAKELTNLLGTPDGASIRASCIDIDSQALLAIARRAAGSGLSGRLTLIQDNAVPTGAEALSLPPQHVIYALGLGEYLSDEQINALLNWAYDVLIPGGSVILTNLASTNPDRALMEHVLDWKAHHRAAEDLRSLLAQSRFGRQPVDILADETDVTLFACCTKPT